MKKAVVLYDSVSGTTQAAAEYITQGIRSVEECEVAVMPLGQADAEQIASAQGVILGSPTYMASASWRMHDWLQKNAHNLPLAGKLGGAFATEQYIHGGAERVLQDILTAELVYGMMVYSGGSAYGKPVIHLGPVGMSQNIAEFADLFREYGKRFALQLRKLPD